MLSGVFVLVGFVIMIAGLQRYVFIAKRLSSGIDELKVISPTLLILVTIVLQVVTVIVLVLYLVGGA
jgi:hypothetical protein